VGSRLPVYVAALLMASACTASAPAQPAGGRSDLISTGQIASKVGSVYDVVRTYHPNWLRIRGPDSLRRSGEIQVYFDGTRIGGIENLKGIAASGISYIRWYDGIEAAARWGLDHGNGVIWVSSTPE
jgi:hypothetical protein